MKKILFLIGFLIGGISIANASSVLFPYQGGTGTSTVPTIGQVLIANSNGTYSPMATSSLGIASGGSVTSIVAGTGLTGGTITATGTIALSVPVSIANGGTGTSTTPTVGQMLVGNNSGSYDLVVPPKGGAKTYYDYATNATSSPTVFNMSTTASTTSTTTNYPTVSNGQILQSYITPVGDPNTTVIPGGTYLQEVYAARYAGSAAVSLFFRVYEVNSSGVVIAQIGTDSAQTPALSPTASSIFMTMVTGNYTMASTASRIMVQIIAATAGTPSVSLAVGNGTDAALTMPGTTIDVSTFVPYTGAIQSLNLGSFDFLTTGSLGSTGSRLLKAWLTDLTVTNAISGSITGNAATVTTNANLTGPITSVGNATSVASQTGTGSKFVMDTNPTFSNNVTIQGVTQIATSTTSGTQFAIQASSTNNIATFYASSSLPVFIINNKGLTGVGTTTPDDALSVQNITGDVDTFDTYNSSGVETFGVSNAGKVGIASSTPTNTLSLGSGSITTTENVLATSTSMTIDWTAGNQQLIRMSTAATAITFASSTPGQNLKLVVCNPPTGTAGALTFSTAINWVNKTTPTQTTTANNCDVWSFFSTNATSTQKYFGAMSPNF